jgi:hypothetical protein
MTARLTDSSAPDVQLSADVDIPAADRYRVEFLAANAAAELVLRFEMTNRKSFAGDDGAIYVGALTVAEQ